MKILLTILCVAIARFNINWRADHFLWKPIAEHYNGLVVVTLPRGEVKSVVIVKGDKKQTLRFRSVGSAGDAWADYSHNGAWFYRHFGKNITVTVTGKKKCTNYVIRDPRKRSDSR